VDQQTSAVILLILIMLLLIFVAFVASNMLMKRAIRDVLKMFRKGEAFSPETAKFQDEIGFKKRSFIQFKALRDYKPTALQLLISNNIVGVTEEGKVYLIEETLATSNLEKRK
jgi:hypothetical protein